MKTEKMSDRDDQVTEGDRTEAEKTSDRDYQTTEQTSEREKKSKLPKTKTKPSEDPYSEIILHKVTEQVNLFQTGNYKVRITVGNMPNVMYPVTEGLNAGAGPNLMS